MDEQARKAREQRLDHKIDVLGVKLSDVVKITYIEDDQEKSLKCMERPREQFYDALREITKCYNGMETGEAKDVVFWVKTVSVKYKDGWIKKYKFTGDVHCRKWGRRPGFVDSDMEYTGDMELDECVNLLLDEAVLYIRGLRSEPNLFEKEKSGGEAQK